MSTPAAVRRGTHPLRGPVIPALVPALVAIGIVAFVRVAWDVPSGVVVQGAIIGGLTSLLALGLALVWRANRVI
ncbi:MAG: hypothetical protein MUP97_05935, partial [Acidimicrobiia bacterium]|nr:hypothetical protein [Acidimicrobiia bacterium]